MLCCRVCKRSKPLVPFRILGRSSDFLLSRIDSTRLCWLQPAPKWMRRTQSSLGGYGWPRLQQGLWWGESATRAKHIRRHTWSLCRLCLRYSASSARLLASVGSSCSSSSHSLLSPPVPRARCYSPFDMKFVSTALALAAFATSAAAQLKILSPGGPNLWWGA